MPFKISRFLACLLLLLAGLRANAIAQDKDPWSRQITFRVQDKSLPDAFRQLFAEVKTAYQISKEAANAIATVTVTMNMENIPLKTVVERLARTARASNKRVSPTFEKDLCILEVSEFGSKPNDAAIDKSPDRHLVTYTAQDISVLRAVTEILDGTKVGYRIHPAVRAAMAAKHVSPKFENTSLGAALTLLLEGIPLKEQFLVRWFEQERGYYVFMPVPERNELHHPDVRVILDPLKPGETAADQRVTMRVKKTDIRDALKTLFQSVNRDYTIDPFVVGTVNVDFVDVLKLPVKDALDKILKSTVGPLTLTYRLEDRIFKVTCNKEYENWK